MMVETVNVACTASSTGQALILVIMYVKSFKLDVIVFISNVIKCWCHSD